MKRTEFLRKTAIVFFLTLILTALHVQLYAVSFPPGKRVFDVRGYGAKADGKTDDAMAIQKAIDDCSKNNGGVVLLDNGTFLSSGITFKSNVELHLTVSALLLGSTDASKYNIDTKLSTKHPIRSLIYAPDCVNIAITGPGKIDGQGDLIKVKTDNERPDLIVLHGSKDIRIQDVFITNSCKFAVFVLQCERLRVEGVKLVNLKNANNDGFDIDGSKDVIINNTNIHSIDDCIALKASTREDVCSNIVITNCILSSRCAAFRVGPDALADIENVTMSNCIIRNTGLNGIKIQESMGAVTRNMTFSNIVMENVKGPISIRLSGWSAGPYNDSWTTFDDKDWEKGKLQNILFENIRATVPRELEMKPEFAVSPAGWLNITKLNVGISITGTSKTRPQGITFSNIDITFAGGGTAEQAAIRNVPDLERDYPEMYMFGELPAYGLYMHHVSGVVLNNVRFDLKSEDLRPAIVCDDVDDLELTGFKATGSKNAESLIRLQNSSNVFINGSRPLNNIGTFLRVEGAKSNDIKLSGNKLNFARKAVEVTVGAKSGAVSYEK
ncbi:glycosyl hydrolase family 28 protein [Chitinophaga sp. MM2321]|uniref:glycoside hydrolase family 28 protein n=1 Tax=Chitinophaga sp. MM2321 TaxID=3137178 RepID=UPI0032D58F17